MRDRDEIVQTAKAIVKQLQPLTSDDTVLRILARLDAAGYEIVRKSDEFRDPTAIAEQRTKGWPDFHPEDFCHRCGHLNGNWFTDLGELEWLTVTGGVGIVCPSCFMALYRAQHGACIWELRSWTPEAPDA